MKFKQILLTACLLLMIWPCLAMAKEEPIIYTVKDGDTLWDISQRFIKDPYYWPSLWSNNPDIGNPHLIYPGQKLRIHDGRIEIIPVGEELSDEAGASILIPDEVRMIATFGGAQSFIGPKEADNLGYLADAIDGRVLITEDDTVFLEMTDLEAVAPGDVYELITVGGKVFHPISDKLMGYQTIQLGTVKITEITPTVAVAQVTDALREIKRGAKVRPFRVIPDQIPRKLADMVVHGYILSDDIGKIAMGQWEVILLDIGEESGLEVGHELDLYRKREATEIAKEARTTPLVLPEIDLGDAIVLEVRHGFAEALIIRTTFLPIFRGDQVRTKTN